MGIRGKLIQAKNGETLYHDYKANPFMFDNIEGARMLRRKQQYEEIVALIDFQASKDFLIEAIV